MNGEKLKEVVEKLWECNRLGDRLLEGIVKLGFIPDRGVLPELCAMPLEVLQMIVGADFAYTDRFADEFLYGEYFTEFWDKWFGGDWD